MKDQHPGVFVIARGSFDLCNELAALMHVAISSRAQVCSRNEGRWFVHMRDLPRCDPGWIITASSITHHDVHCSKARMLTPLSCPTASRARSLDQSIITTRTRSRNAHSPTKKARQEMENLEEDNEIGFAVGCAGTANVRKRWPTVGRDHMGAPLGHRLSLLWFSSNGKGRGHCRHSPPGVVVAGTAACRCSVRKTLEGTV
jgi:hypothetical protein